jgi:ketosteroid isomerase-like protein
MGHSDTHRTLHDLFNARGYDDIEAYLAPGFMYEDLSRVVTVKTPGEFTDYLRGWVTAFGDAAVGSPQYAEGADHSVCTFHGRGVNDGELGPFAPSGRPMDLVFCEVLHYAADGTVLSGQLHYDQLTLLTQLGHATPPVAAGEAASAEQAVRELFADFDRMDAAAMKAAMTGDAQGVDEISRAWLRDAASFGGYLDGLGQIVSGVRSELRDLHVVTWGETALTTFWLEQDYTMAGTPEHVSAPTTVVLRREPDRWRTALVHSVPLPDED